MCDKQDLRSIQPNARVASIYYRYMLHHMMLVTYRNLSYGLSIALFRLGVLIAKKGLGWFMNKPYGGSPSGLANHLLCRGGRVGLP